MEIAAAAGRTEIDTSRPFQSVREAVGVFGERCIAGGSSSHESSEPGSKFSVAPASSPSSTLLDCLKKLEADLAEAKTELVQLKQRQSHIEMAVSSISVQFSKDLAIFSDLKKGKEPAVVGAAIREEEDGDRVRSDRWDESLAEEWMASLEYLPSLSEALTIKMIQDDLEGRKERKVKKVKKAKNKQHKKQKNGISLVGGIFSKKDKTRVPFCRTVHKMQPAAAA